MSEYNRRKGVAQKKGVGASREGLRSSAARVGNRAR